MFEFFKHLVCARQCASAQDIHNNHEKIES